MNANPAEVDVPDETSYALPEREWVWVLVVDGVKLRARRTVPYGPKSAIEVFKSKEDAEAGVLGGPLPHIVPMHITMESVIQSCKEMLGKPANCPCIGYIIMPERRVVTV